MGEFAFPRVLVGSEWPKDGDVWLRHSGMTLRDYFAAKAMQGMLAATDPRSTHYVDVFADTASASYKFADAMLKAREA